MNKTKNLANQLGTNQNNSQLTTNNLNSQNVSNLFKSKKKLIFLFLGLILFLLATSSLTLRKSQTQPSQQLTPSLSVTPTPGRYLTCDPGFILICEGGDCECLPQKDETTNWKTYRNDQYVYEIKYPSGLLTLKENLQSIQLEHSIPYKHLNPCNFSDALTSDIDEIVDFSIRIETENNNLETALKDRENFLYNNYWIKGKLMIRKGGYEEEFSINNLSGYKITRGIENCGWYLYYLENQGKTIIVKRDLVPELSPINKNYNEYMALPNMISPEEENELFNQILSTFKFLE